MPFSWPAPCPFFRLWETLSILTSYIDFQQNNILSCTLIFPSVLLDMSEKKNWAYVLMCISYAPTRKPNSCMQTTKAQTRMHICTTWSVPLLLSLLETWQLNKLYAIFRHSYKSLYLSRLVSNHIWLETLKTSYSVLRSIYKSFHCNLYWLLLSLIKQTNINEKE